MTVPIGLANARDLGGLPVQGGGRTRFGVLYRSDMPFASDPDPALRPWPPSTVIDLRSPAEHTAAHPLHRSGTSILSFPLMPDDPVRLAIRTHGLQLADLYEEILRSSSEQLVRIAAVVASAAGPTLVHCSVGKDRTGVAIAVLLAAVGVAREHVAADYKATAQHLGPLLDRLVVAQPAERQAAIRAQVDAMPEDLVGAPARAIHAVLDRISTPQSGGTWLVTRGLPTDQLTALRERLVDRDHRPPGD